MAKATHASGVSYTDHETSEPDAGVVIRRAEIGFVDWAPQTPEKIVDVKLAELEAEDEEETEWQTSQSDGTDSSGSSKSAVKPTESNTHFDREPARTTESHSSPRDAVKVADSGAGSTAGHGRSIPRKPSSSTPKKAANPRSVRSRSISADEDDFSEFE